MFRSLQLSVLAALLILSLPLTDALGRGRGGGGGGFSGGRGGGSNFGGGGFSGGRSGGNFGGGARSGGNFGGGGLSGGNFGGVARSGSSFGGGNLGGGARSGGNSGGGNFGGGGFSGGHAASPRGASNFSGGGQVAGRTGQVTNFGGAQRGGGQARNSYSRPSNDQLGNFLGMPSDGGMHSPAASGRRQPNQLPAGEGRFDVNTGTATGPRGGQAAGATVTGPQGNTVGRAVGVGADGGVGSIGGVQGSGGNAAARGVAVGPDGGVAAVGGVKGASGGAAVRGAAVGPDGAVAGRAAVGPGGYGRGGVVASGPAGVAAGFTRVTPSGRYTAAAAVRTNYDHWGIYGDSWYTAHPGAWYATGWATGAAWRAATWDSVGAWMSYPVAQPIYYDYGNTVTSDGDNVYVDGQSAGTTQEYYQQASDLATAGAAADAPADSDWLPLGVFALTKGDHEKSVVSLELAVNKQGIIRGNYTDTETGKTQPIQGSVDKQTQRVAFSVGDHSQNFIETGLYNLTKDEAPALIHVGQENTEQWLLVRLQKPDSASS